jgi:hypothetical protein
MVSGLFCVGVTGVCIVVQKLVTVLLGGCSWMWCGAVGVISRTVESVTVVLLKFV